MARTAGLLLAAGAGRRFGGPKALAVLPDGTGFLAHAVQTLREGGCAPVVAVLGASAERARSLVKDVHDVQVVVNDEWATGMGSSLRRGLTALPPDIDAALVLLVDTPGIGRAAVARLAALADRDVIAVASYAGRRGHPVLIGRAHWPEVSRLAVGDNGARQFLRAHSELVHEIPCDDVADPADIDTADDLPLGRMSTGQ